tara:strand:+ start:570 stop:1040 length:471 start_codon:yes stop_codon:yes gene_type:complete
MKILYTFFLIATTIVPFSQSIRGKTIHPNENSSKKIERLKSNIFTDQLISNIPSNQTPIIQEGNKADQYLKKAIEEFKKSEKFILKGKKDFRRAKRYLNNANRTYQRGESRISQLRVESKLTKKTYEKSQEDYIKGLNYLNNALDFYGLYLKEITR